MGTLTEQLKELALRAGFSRCHPLNTDALVFRQEVRDMCASDKCKNYGKSWSCPPAIDSLNTIAEKAKKYNAGLIVQTTGHMEDLFDIESIGKISVSHKKSWDTFVRQALAVTEYDALPMASGACSICKKCTFPDKPCRFPKKVFPSMEAYGLWVSDVCEKSNLDYYYSEKTMTYTACILYNER